MKNKLHRLIFIGLLIAIGILLSQLLSFSYPPRTTIIKFGIGYVPLIIISILYGPKYGFVSAVLQDILGFFLFGNVNFYFGFTLNAVLYGIVPSLIFMIKKEKSSKLFFYFNIGILILLIAAAFAFVFNIDVISSNTSFTETYRYILTAIGIASSAVLFGISLWFYRRKEKVSSFQQIFFTVLVLYIIVSLILTPLWIYDLYSVSVWAQLPIRIIKMPVEVLLYTIIIERLLVVLKRTEIA